MNTVFGLKLFVHPNGRRRWAVDQHMTLEEQDNGNWLLLPVHPAVKPLKRGRR